MFLKWTFLLVSVSWSISTVSWLPAPTPLRSVTSLTELLSVEGPSLPLSLPEDAVCSLTGGPPSPSSVCLFLDPVAPSWNINRGTCWPSYQLQITRVAVDWRVKLGLYWTSKPNTQTNKHPTFRENVHILHGEGGFGISQKIWSVLFNDIKIEELFSLRSPEVWYSVLECVWWAFQRHLSGCLAELLLQQWDVLFGLLDLLQ